MIVLNDIKIKIYTDDVLNTMRKPIFSGKTDMGAGNTNWQRKY